MTDERPAQRRDVVCELRVGADHRAGRDITVATAPPKRHCGEVNNLPAVHWQICRQAEPGGARGGTEPMYVASHRMVALAPESEWQYKVALAAFQTNRPREAVRVLSQLYPSRGWIRNWHAYWDVLIEARHSIHDYAGELAGAGRHAAMLPNEVDPLRLLIPSLTAFGRVTVIDSVLDRALPVGAATDWADRATVFATAVIELRAHGHLDAARRVLDRFTTWRNTLPHTARGSCDLLGNEWVTTFYAERFARSLDCAREWARHCPADPEGLVGVALSAALRAAARVAAFFGERERAVALLREALRRNGWFVANLDFDVPLERLRGYTPYDELRRPRD